MVKKEDKKSHPEARGLLLLALSFFVFLCLVSFHAGSRNANWLGPFGHTIAWVFAYLFGIMSFFVLGFVGWVGWKYLSIGKCPQLFSKALYFSLFLFSAALLLNVAAENKMPIPGALKHKILTEVHDFPLPYPHREIRSNLGGVPFYYLYRDVPQFSLQRMLTDTGVAITCSLLSLVALFFLTEVRLSNLRTEKVKPTPRKVEDVEKSLAPPPPKALKKEEPQIHIRTHTDKTEKKETTPRPAPKKGLTTYQLPPPSLLTSPEVVDQPMLKKELRRQAEILEESLLSFGIEAKVGDIHCGPTITSFEVHPAIGVKVQKITALESDIALKLEAKSIRIIAPIPGKAAVGVEIPSPHPQEVSFKDMLISYQQSPRKLTIPVILGKTVTGENVISDLAKMPHCLIAGATGSGKSVCINTLIMSLLMNARPDEVKLIMVDPKKVELTQYTNLPHMIAPVITEPHGAYAALSWLVNEMQVRYEILKQLGLRNITAFNLRTVNKDFEASLSQPIPEQMPMIVAIIDEFADLMMASSSDLETPIARIAQMARAVGIHLVLATQRPSREVITGLIKANFPTRIAFKVASRVNSQIILDDNGADSLLGNGDMLFLPPGTSHLIRAQGAYIRDEDINRVIDFITAQGAPSYLISSFDKMPSGALGDEEDSKDDLYDQARSIVIETQTASTTFLQRKLKIGYARSASLMDELEARGVISPQEGSKPRRVLIDEPGARRD
ncbi:MAG: DNA translocase FtsK 4TM domain-containing protein [Verrucomicrobia bacterium]|nr:DNA translocase FtsK 4TM domain-containing protein [Verrucomicrobiota bacterium]